MLTSLSERMRHDSLKKLVDVAKMMQQCELDIISGSKAINRLRIFTENPSDPIFDSFISLSHAPEEQITNKFTEANSVNIVNSCNKLIEKFQ